jgi:hypothetical protein
VIGMKKNHLLLYLSILMTIPPLATAQSLGTHCWQQAPFAHILCFDVNDVNGRYFTVVGENIVEGASYPVDGSALFDNNNNNNVFRLSFTQNLGGTFVFENAVTIDPTTLSGTWTDDGGNSGEFQYLGMGPLDPEKIKAITTRRGKKVRSVRRHKRG